MHNLPLITEMLRHHPWSRKAVEDGYVPVFSKMGIDPNERAKILIEDMEKIGCDWPIRSLPVDEHIVLSHYEVPETGFGKEDATDSPEAFKAHGTGLDWGSIIRLSKACEIGRRYFQVEWPNKFRHEILNERDHFSFIEEILWLNLWHGVSEIDYEAQPFLNSGCAKHIDWRFKSCGQTINLEIKYRPRDWMRKVDGAEFNVTMPSYYYDVPQKFPARLPGELNLVGVSTPAPIDRSLRERTEILLREHETIDGVIIWSQSAEGTHPFEIHALRQKELINTFFTNGDIEDAAHIGLVRHLWRKRDERRAYRGQEVPALLRNLSKSITEVSRTQADDHIGQD